MPDRQVLILGAAGRLGRELTLAFARAGWHTRAQHRGDAPPEWAVLPGVHAVRTDALDAAGTAAAAQGCSVVINALNPPYHRWGTLALPLARAAQAAAARAGALLMLPGNVYNFGRELPALLGPDTPVQAGTPKAAIRIAMEDELAGDAALDSVVLRAGDFFGGAGRGSWFDRALLSRWPAGQFVYPGDPALAHAWAYLPDLARAFVAVAERRAQLAGHSRLHFAGHTLSGLQLQQALEEAGGRALQLGGMPWRLIALASPLVPAWRAVLEMRYLWQRPHALDGGALAALIGPEPHTPLRPALQAALQALGFKLLYPEAGLPTGQARR